MLHHHHTTVAMLSVLGIVLSGVGCDLGGDQCAALCASTLSLHLNSRDIAPQGRLTFSDGKVIAFDCLTGTYQADPDVYVGCFNNRVEFSISNPKLASEATLELTHADGASWYTTQHALDWKEGSEVCGTRCSSASETINLPSSAGYKYLLIENTSGARQNLDAISLAVDGLEAFSSTVEDTSLADGAEAILGIPDAGEDCDAAGVLPLGVGDYTVVTFKRRNEHLGIVPGDSITLYVPSGCSSSGGVSLSIADSMGSFERVLPSMNSSRVIVP